jgi:glutathione synthase
MSRATNGTKPMRIAFYVNALATEETTYSTTLLAHEAQRRGHEVFYISVEDLCYQADGSLAAHAWGVPAKRYRSDETFLEAIRGETAQREWVDLESLDVILLRNDPARDQGDRPWAVGIGLLFGQEAARRGVLVLNDPAGLARAVNKMYLQSFPQEVRPVTLITRDDGAIKEFVKENRDRGVVIKPLSGSGGEGVFLVKGEDQSNLNQILEAVRRYGYVIVQEYLPAAREGDTRFFLLNGRPLEVNGKYAAFCRIGQEGDLRTNISAGGRTARCKMTDRVLELAELVRPRLVRDGMFLVGLDVAGDKLMEINVFSPGGLRVASHYEGVDFGAAVMDAVESKVQHREHAEGQMENVELATL